MSISIYYTARRPTPLSGPERAEINEIIKKYSVEKEIERYLQTGDGHNWESFCIYDPKNPSEHDVVFEGATSLPDNSEDAIWFGVQHWCSALTEIRKVIPDASWDVYVDDHEIQWDVHAGVFDPSQ